MSWVIQQIDLPTAKGFLTGFVVGAFLYRQYQIMFNDSNKGKDEEEINECLFFTEKGTTCPEMCILKDRSICKLETCNRTHYSKLLDLIKQSKTHLDICVYLLTAEEVCHTIVKVFKKGVYVRIIMDKQMSEEASGTKLLVFRREFIPLQLKGLNTSVSSIMHNKFAVVDREVLVTGSFNWTRQAFSGNCENAIVTSNRRTVQRFSRYFEEMWAEEEPSTSPQD